MRPIHENTITLIGHIMGDLYQETIHGGEPFYHGTMAVKRQSGTWDYLPITIPGRLLDRNAPYAICGKQVCVSGELRSVNQDRDGKNRCMTLILAGRITPTDAPDQQRLTLEGVICKEPTYRTTPLGREISDLIIAVDRARGSSYIPVVVWGREARKISRERPGTVIHLEGRFQSRVYTKKLEIGGEVERTCFEVSARTCDVIGCQRRLIAQ